MQKLVDNENITTDMSSYMIFTNLLGKVLKRLVQMDAKNHIMKIIGKYVKNENTIHIFHESLSIFKVEFIRNLESQNYMD